MIQEKLTRMHIAAILTAAYQPSTQGMSAIDCENAKITQFERMYALVGLADTPEGEKVFPTPTASGPLANVDPTIVQQLIKALPDLLKLIPGPVGTAAATVGAVLPAVTLPAK